MCGRDRAEKRAVEPGGEPTGGGYCAAAEGGGGDPAGGRYCADAGREGEWKIAHAMFTNVTQKRIN